MITRRAFLGRLLGVAAAVVAAPALLAVSARRARDTDAYRLAKTLNFARMYGATPDQLCVVVTGRSVGKTTCITELSKRAAGRSFFVAGSPYRVIELDFQDMEARILAHAQSVAST